MSSPSPYFSKRLPQIAISLIMLISTPAFAADDKGINVASTIIKLSSGQSGALQSGVIKMPYIQMDEAEIASRINDHLYVNTWQTLAPRKYVAEWRDGKPDTAGIAALEYTSDFPKPGLLHLQLQTEYCGAYCDTGHMEFTYELKTGRFLGLSDVLLPAAEKLLDQKIREERVKQYRSHIAQLQADLKTSKKTRAKPEKISELEDRISFNEDCLEQAKTNNPDRPSWRQSLDTALASRFLEDKLVLIIGRCSNHAMRALDDVDRIEVGIAYQSLRPYMTPYGRTILLNEGEVLASSWSGQLLRGSLGNNPITMLLHTGEGHSVNGYYFYDKYRQSIYINGNIKDELLDLEEGAVDSSGATYHLRLRVKGKQLSGQWQGKKALPLELLIP